ncbi:MAG: cyclic lactone autoinducer peptide [Lachnospiraceae bacterium]|nr:cyclic lactone autoinducer peptide [Lachnospiraceae bacterium]NBJ82420.1 cyclic lactone autoinducer peptide [bacterium 1XD42-76]NBK05713.1 cyclic lactone autoinducer peptide [bacterium 1XD42-94]
MSRLLEFVVWMIEKVAESGAGFFSWGMAYEPEIPEELLK